MTYTPEPTELIRLIAAYPGRLNDDREALADHGWTFDHGPLTEGQVAVVHSRGYYRRGIVTKVGRVNAKVTYTTAGAVESAAEATEYHQAVAARHDNEVRTRAERTADRHLQSLLIDLRSKHEWQREKAQATLDEAGGPDAYRAAELERMIGYEERERERSRRWLAEDDGLPLISNKEAKFADIAVRNPED